jgi:protein-disulfide isomerase
MTFGQALRGIVLAGLALIAADAGAQSARPASPAGRNWNATVAATDAGHRIGNPAAAVKLTEYISYTCPHCAAFAREGEGPLQLAYITPGKVSLEVRHLIRDPIDLTAAMLVHCGPVAKFPQNHAAFLGGQAGWIAPLANHTDAQEQRWRTRGVAGRKAIATDFGFYRIMERRGYTRAQTDQCLADDALAARLAAASDKDWKRPGISGTPAFALDGSILAGTHSWDSLQTQLAARF